MVKTLRLSGETKSKLLMSKETAEFSVIHERMPSGTSEVRHFHRQARQFFFVLSSTARLEIEAVRGVLRAHQGLEVPPEVPHQMFSESDQAIKFLVVSQPANHGDRVLVEGDKHKTKLLLDYEHSH